MIAAWHLVLRGNGPLDFVVIAPVITWAVLIGALYGLGTLIRDVWRAYRRKNAEMLRQADERRRAEP
jgi:hypothetical protein